MAQPRDLVQAPPARPPSYGLIAAAPVIEDRELRWPAGWNYLPEGCGASGKLSVECVGNTAEMNSADGPGLANVVQADPIWIFAADECSSFGFASRDWMGRARRQLAASESYELADEFWNGTVTTAEPLNNRFLAGPAAESDTVTTAAATPVAALGCITAGLAFYLRGQQGMIHVTPQLLQHLVADSLVTRQGNLWVSAMGHIVVADAGYTGTGPGGVAAGATQWAYGTSIIQVRLGPVEVMPSSLDDARNLAMALDYEVNSIAVFAGRLAAFQWSNECAHVAAEVSLPTCDIGGAA